MPAILPVLAVVAFIASCAKAKRKEEQPASTDAGGSERKDATARDAVVGVDAISDAGMGRDALGPVDVERHDAETGGDAETGVDAVVQPMTPTAPTFDRFIPNPRACTFTPAFNVRRQNNGAPSLYLSCTHRLHRMNLVERRDGGITRTSSTAWNSIAAVNGLLAHQAFLPDGRIVVDYSSPHGFAIFNEPSDPPPATLPSAHQEVDFSGLTYTTTAGGSLQLIPSFPAGIAHAGGKLCFNMNSLTDVTKLICFSYGSEGRVDVSSAQGLFLSGKNGTSLGVYGGDLIAVSANTYEPAAGGGAFIDRLNPTTGQRVRRIPLTDHADQPITAQLSPNVEITADGLALVSWQGPSHGFMLVDLNSGIVRQKWNLSNEVTNFISSITFTSFGGDDRRAIITDFGRQSGIGRTIFVDLRSNGWEGHPYRAVRPYLGTAAVLNDELLQTAGDGIHRASLERLR